MNEITIPSSPNWYESKIFVCANDNTLIYGSRSEIIIIDPTPCDYPLRVKIIPSAHNGRVLSVDAHHAWTSNAAKKIIVSVGEDRIVKLWDALQLTCLYENEIHLQRLEKLVASVFTLIHNVVSVSEQGFISIWNIETNMTITQKNIFPPKIEITTLEACTVIPWFVAFGSKCGLVLIVDIRKLGKLIYKIRAHDKGIVSLSWCPVVDLNDIDVKLQEVTRENAETKKDISAIGNSVIGDVKTQSSGDNFERNEEANDKKGVVEKDILENDDNEEINGGDPKNPADKLLLSTNKIDIKDVRIASSCRNGSIKIWCAGRQELAISAPFQKGKKNYKGSDYWIALYWIGARILLSSSPTGELVEWTLNLNKKLGDSQQDKYKRRVIHNHHGSTIFVITAPWNLYPEMHDLYVWTIGQERYILCCSLEPKSSLRVSYPTIGGCIYCIANSPLVPTKLALGLGDNTVKIWDISHPENQRITMINVWRSIQGKVFTLAWHPTNENQLAFGTHEGRIGLINVNKPSSAPSLLFQHFRTAVHQVVWGPINGNKDLGLYACGEGEVVIYDTSLALAQEPKTIQVQAKKFATCMAWKPDYTQFAIGFKSGEFDIYDGSLIYKFTIFCEHKALFNIVWHPEFTEEDNSRSPNHSWIATSTADAFIIIYDLNCETITDGSVESNHRLIVELHGHSKPVTCMCWSPYENSKLASSGQDGIIQVWDVISSTIIGTYYGHNYEKILSVCWSPLKKDYLISGGKDNCIRIWDLTKQRAITEENLQEIQKESIRLKQNRNKPKQPNENDDQEANKKVKRGAMLNLTSRAQNSPCTMVDDCKRILSSITQKKPAQDVDAKAMNNFDITRLFGDKSEVLQLLEMEQEKHAEKRKYTSYQHLALWKGNLAEALKEAISNQTVTPWLISMAPMVSPKLWQEACAVYTTKLLEDTKTDPFELISYLLACHKVEEAVKVLCDETLFREALALAKCRLPKDHPLINEVISSWAKFAVVNGSFEIAAQCFIVLEQYEEATKALFKRSDVKTLEFAVELAEKTGNKHLIDAVTLRYNSFKNHPETPQENIASNIVNDLDVMCIRDVDVAASNPDTIDDCSNI